MVDSHRVDALDRVRVRQAHVRDELLHVHGRNHAHEQHELAKGCAQPDTRNQDGEENGAHGIDPPH